MKVLTFVFCFQIVLLFSFSLFSADTLVFQEGLDGYNGTTDTFVERGYYQPSHATHGSDKIIEVGSS